MRKMLTVIVMLAVLLPAGCESKKTDADWPMGEHTDMEELNK